MKTGIHIYLSLDPRLREDDIGLREWVTFLQLEPDVKMMYNTTIPIERAVLMNGYKKEISK